MISRLLYLLIPVVAWFVLVTPSPTNHTQIVDPDEKFLLGDGIKEWDIGSDYEVVAIVGSQSSGKSTFLNNVFGTNFAVMDSTSRGQTTKGIWLSRDKTHNIIVMDVEGSDGGSHGDDQKFERKSALFAMACSRLLVINIWENQVGLYNGANMGLLKIVFEEHLSLYGNLDRRKYSRPRILFVMQDHSSNISLESLARTITLDLNKTWDSIAKPDELKDETLQGYFDFEFESLPHLFRASEKYNCQVNSLRRRFVDKENMSYLLKDAYANPVPADGLALYMKTVWETIRSNEKLNLPGQHELLARAMCEKISNSLLGKYRDTIASQFAILNEGKVIDDLGSLLQNWKSELLVHYDEEARRYARSVYVEKRVELIHSYHDEVLKLFMGQLRNIRISLLVAFDAVLEGAVEKEGPEFASIISNAKREYKDEFSTAARNIALSGANWDWGHELEELESSLSQKIVASERERTASTPIEASKEEWVGSEKLISTKAALYRNGMLLLNVYTRCRDAFHGLRGRVLVVVRDKDGNVLGATGTMHCTTRGSTSDIFTRSSGHNDFQHHFSRKVGLRAHSLDIIQSDG